MVPVAGAVGGAQIGMIADLLCASEGSGRRIFAPRAGRRGPARTFFLRFAPRYQSPRRSGVFSARTRESRGRGGSPSAEACRARDAQEAAPMPVIIEPFRIKVVEPIALSDRRKRERDL